MPHFRFGKNGSGGVGQGDGEQGTVVGAGGDAEGGSGNAGSDPGAHILEVEVSLQELAAILGEELELPRIEPKGKANIDQKKARYSSIRRNGPESLRHFKRTYMEALRRQISSNTYVPERPRIVPIREDKRYRAWSEVDLPEANAVLIYIMDVSGSMTDEQKEIVRTAAFWLDTWLRSQYQGVETRYIIHDAAAKEVDEQTFYHTRESGGTRISSAYTVCADLIAREFSPSEWNIYCFQFSDGDNWGEDNEKSLALSARHAVAASQFVLLRTGRKPVRQRRVHPLAASTPSVRTEERLILAELENKEAIYPCLKAIPGHGSMTRS